MYFRTAESYYSRVSKRRLHRIHEGLNLSAFTPKRDQKAPFGCNPFTSEKYALKIIKKRRIQRGGTRGHPLGIIDKSNRKHAVEYWLWKARSIFPLPAPRLRAWYLILSILHHRQTIIETRRLLVQKTGRRWRGHFKTRPLCILRKMLGHYSIKQDVRAEGVRGSEPSPSDWRDH